MIKKFESWVKGVNIDKAIKLRICKDLGLRVSGEQVLKYKGTCNPNKPSGWQMVCHIYRLEMYVNGEHEKGEISDEDYEKYCKEFSINKDLKDYNL